MSRFLGLYPSLGLSAPVVLGTGGGREWTPIVAKGGGKVGKLRIKNYKLRIKGLSADDADDCISGMGKTTD